MPIMFLRGLIIPLWYLFAATELTTSVLCRSLVTDQADAGDEADVSARAVGEASEGVRTHSYREAATGLIRNDRIIKEDRVHPLQTHHVVFVKQRKMYELMRILHDTSDPGSVNHRKRMSAT